MTAGLADTWPATRLRARAGGLELRWIDDDLLARLAAVAADGVHDPGTMPFLFPWTRGTPEEVARSVVAYQWSVRPRIGPEHLTLELAALVDGEPVGVQAADGADWGVLRRVETGSWLGRAFQGRGIGTRMRVLMLHLLFEGLDAAAVTSAAFTDNTASQTVSRRAGYLDNGVVTTVREGEPAEQQRYLMTRARWHDLRDAHAEILGSPVELDGVDAVRAQASATGRSGTRSTRK